MKLFYGVAELAKVIGWTTEKTHTYFKRKKFIKPAAMVGNRPLWTEKQIREIEREMKENGKG